MKLIAATAVAVAAVAFTGNLQAATITHDIVTVPVVSFNPVAASTTGTVYYDRIGSSSGQWRSPFENTNGTHIDPQYGALQYTSIQANSSGIWNVALSDTLKLFWGSPDTYNYIQFYAGKDGTGTLLDTVVGTAIIPPSTQGMGHDLVSILVSGFFQSVRLRSDNQNAFEFTNFQASCEECAAGETPIPGALPLFAGGLGMIGFLARRKKRKAQLAA